MLLVGEMEIRGVAQPVRTPAALRQRWASADRCIGIVVTQNLPEIRALFGHGFRTGLAEADAVPLACPCQEDLIAFLLRNEVIALNGSPTETAIEARSEEHTSELQSLRH